MNYDSPGKPQSLESGFLQHINLFNIIAVAVIVSTLKLLSGKWYLLAWLPAASLVVAYLAIKHHNKLLYAFIFLVPFNAYTGLFEGYQFLTIPKLIGILLILVLIFRTITSQSRLKIPSPLWKWLGIFLLLSIVSSLFSEFPGTSVNNLRKMLTAFIVFYFTLYFFREKDITSTLSKIFILSISSSALLSVVGYLFDIPVLSIGHEGTALKRATGAENDPNFMASMAIFSLPFICHYLSVVKNSLEKFFLFSLFAINIAAIILTYSRSGAVVLGIVMILLIRFYSHYITPKRLGFSIIGLFAGLLVFALSMPASYWDRLGTVTDTKTDTSLGRRWSYLDVAQERFLDSPVLGSGPGTFRDYYAESIHALAFQKEGKTNRRAAHNAYVEILIGTGIAGLLCYLALLYRSLKLFRQARLKFTVDGKEELASLTHAYCVGLVALLSYSLFLSNQYLEYIWLGFGISQQLFNLSNAEEKT